ncbi:MAG: RNA 2',3'-cyclic phosphodiesterase [Planctomycetes bacterium]|nr:RNA 2',3'-cyclic phosphodiesterase [Planctomycetota bacterium]
MEVGVAMRLFVAIELDRRLKDSLSGVQSRLREFDGDVRWTGPEQMHLTVKFLGEVPNDQVEVVCGAAATVARGVEPFEIALGPCGCFPPRGRVRIVQVGTVDEAGCVARCHELCEQAYEELGFPREQRAFTPHLTVGRVGEDRSNGRLRERAEQIRPQPVKQRAEALCVVQTLLSKGGAQYNNVVRHELGRTD